MIIDIDANMLCLSGF